jgi:hypothetical protein
MWLSALLLRRSGQTVAMEIKRQWLWLLRICLTLLDLFPESIWEPLIESGSSLRPLKPVRMEMKSAG